MTPGRWQVRAKVSRRDIFYSARCASLNVFSSLLTSFLCLYVLFHSCCSHAQVFGKTLMHEFHISYCHAKWQLLSSLRENGDKIFKLSAVKLNSKLKKIAFHEHSTHGDVDKLQVQVSQVIDPLLQGLATPQGTVGPELWVGRFFFFFGARFTSFHTHSSLLTFFFCFFVLCHSCCSLARVFEKTHLQEFVSCVHTEWYLLFSNSATTSAQRESGAIWQK